MKVGDSLDDVESLDAHGFVWIDDEEVELNTSPDISVLDRSIVIHARASDDPNGAGPRVACCKIKRTGAKKVQKKFNQMIPT